MPEGGLNIRLGDHWIAQEERLLEYKRWAAEAFSRANGMDRRMHGKRAPRSDLSLGQEMVRPDVGAGDPRNRRGVCPNGGVTTYKVGQTWPLDMKGFFLDGRGARNLIVVVDGKAQADRGAGQGPDLRRPRAGGGSTATARAPMARSCFQSHFALDPADIARKLGPDPDRGGARDRGIRAGPRQRGGGGRAARTTARFVSRTPGSFGLPHNTSTIVPEDARAGARDGCHFMVKWRTGNHRAFTHIGGEGGTGRRGPFSTRKHVFRTWRVAPTTTGILGFRASVAAKANITYKILFNDAVAMRGAASRAIWTCANRPRVSGDGG